MGSSLNLSQDKASMHSWYQKLANVKAIEKSIKAFKDSNFNIKGFGAAAQANIGKWNDSINHDSALVNYSLQFDNQNSKEKLKLEDGGQKIKRLYDSIDTSILRQEEERSLSLNYWDEEPGGADPAFNSYNMGSRRWKKRGGDIKRNEAPVKPIPVPIILNEHAKESITTKESTNHNTSIQKILKPPKEQLNIHIESKQQPQDEGNESIIDSIGNIRNSDSVKLPMSRSQYYEEDYENWKSVQYKVTHSDLRKPNHSHTLNDSISKPAFPLSS